ncbi:LamG-like jellyroll fold domain-containing protein [Botrimarina sp.]|uniref:LamG-like jellyroll fold domain-containing protein n=1 Tax=Botrimarina sp. TaxID=2795802 RepID=UPI0032EB83B0
MPSAMKRSISRALPSTCCLLFAAAGNCHQGPDPVAHWVFNSRACQAGACVARLGPDLAIEGEAKPVSDSRGGALELLGPSHIESALLGEPLTQGAALTVAAWVLIDEAEQHGGVAGEFGGAGDPRWVLGYDSDRFTFTVRPEGSKTPVTLTGRTPYAKGKWTHVAGVYDGEVMQLYVNGQPDGQTDAASGPLMLVEQPRVAVGHRPDHPAAHPLRGRLREVSVYGLAAKPAWVAHEFDHQKQLVSLQRDARADSLAMIVEPYLQFGTREGMTVMWQTSVEGSSVVRYGETDACDRKAEGDPAAIHEVRIEGLEPEAQYFYRVETTDGAGQSVASGVSTFSTAALPGTPFAFAVISDTQFNPVVSGKLSEFAWAQRPSFLLHPGDLVDTGVNDAHWTQHFFPGMRPLISRVPFYSVLGNHEQNASNYYEYVSLPDPEYYYEFRYGDAHFFMIDTNRNVGPGSEQHEWLDDALGASDAVWKFACHHHPPYSSDENDYGDLWKQNKSTRGDLRARELSRLYDKHRVDIVWNGHIHSYERTWPVRDGKAVGAGGPIYMIVGGGGGGLETPAPSRPFFQNQVRRAHHYVMAHVNGPTLELRSYDLDDRLFDTVRIEKPARAGKPAAANDPADTAR